MKEQIRVEQLTIVPANDASWDDLAAIFGTADYPARCQCQRFKVLGWMWRDSTQEERTVMLRTQTGCGDPDAPATSGLVAYVDGEPAGWVAVEPRTAYPKLLSTRMPWSDRDEDKDDDGIWPVTCFVDDSPPADRHRCDCLIDPRLEAHGRTRGDVQPETMRCSAIEPSRAPSRTWSLMIAVASGRFSRSPRPCRRRASSAA